MHTQNPSIDPDKFVRKTWMVSPVHISAINQETDRTKYSESEIVRRALDGYFFKRRRNLEFTQPSPPIPDTQNA